MVANCSTTQTFGGAVLRDPHVGAGTVSVGYSTRGTTGTSTTSFVTSARFFDRSNLTGSDRPLPRPLALSPAKSRCWYPASR